MNGTNGNDTLTGGASDDDLNGLAGDDILIGGLGFDSLRGGDGTDTAVFTVSSTEIDVYFSFDGSVYVATPNEGADQLFDVEQLQLTDGLFSVDDFSRSNRGFLPGTNNGDDLSVQNGPVLFYGRDGDDTLTGTAEADFFDGGNDNDSITAGAGDDILMGGLGNDTLAGGAGDDTIVIRDDLNNLTVTEVGNDLQVVSADGTDLVRADVEFAQLDSGMVTFAALQALANGNVIYGTAASENVNGTANTETIFALEGSD